MKRFLDLQSIQGESGARGIGRLSGELARAIVRNASDNEVWLGLTDRLPVPWDRVAEIGGDHVPKGRVATFALNGQTAEIDPRNIARARVSERIREAFIADLAPDVVHLNSLFEGYVEDNTTSIGAFESTPATAVTLYDLIPFLRQDAYLHNDAHRAWYFRKIESLRRADHLLAISQSAKREAMECLGFAGDRISVVYAGVDDYFRPIALSGEQRAYLGEKFGLTRPFVMYTANTDARKNIDGLIEAFAALPAAIRESRQLVIVMVAHPAILQPLVAQARNLGILTPQIVFTGFVANQDLRLLYSACELFVFLLCMRDSVCRSSRPWLAARRSSLRIRAACPRSSEGPTASSIPPSPPRLRRRWRRC